MILPTRHNNRTRTASSLQTGVKPSSDLRGRHRRRMIVLFLSLAAALAIISGRLFSLQVHQHPRLVEAANRQYRRVGPPGSPPATRLAKALNLPSQKVLERLKSDKPFVWIKRRVSPEEATAVSQLGLRGIASIAESRRFYPKQGLGAHLLGFVGVDDRGLEGLELQYDDCLAGKPKWVVREQDALGRPIFREEAGGAAGGGLWRGGCEGVQQIPE